MLSDIDISQLAEQMKLKSLEGCFYKDELKTYKFKPKKGYIINLEDETAEGFGSHYTLLYSQPNARRNNELEYFYFDSYGFPCPKEVYAFTKSKVIPSNKGFNIQGRFNNSCGYYCIACLYFITTYSERSTFLYDDV